MSKVYIAADHTGFALKAVLVSYLEMLNHEVEDLGAHEFAGEDDYPDLIAPCAKKVAESNGAAHGIVIGGSGQGEAMVANRVPGVRAVVFYGQAHAVSAIDAEGAPSLDGFDIVRLGREHNNANVLSLAARFISEDEAREAVRIFMETSFSGAERHVRRIGKF